MGTGGEVHFLHRVFEIAVSLSRQLAMLADLTGTHRRVRGVGKFPETLKLDLTRGDDTLADDLGFLTEVRVGRQLAEIDERNLDVEIDAV